MISIHAPRMGSDYPITITPLGISAFQSTLPGWGATRRHNHGGQTRGDFNPRSPDGERPVEAPLRSNRGLDFNPRSPDGERHGIARHRPRSPRFQSTLPGWGATATEMTTAYTCVISIHAPRMGSDRRDGRPRTRIVISIHAPRMGSDRRIRPVGCDRSISIHAPRMGSDTSAILPSIVVVSFQSTLPGWGATVPVMPWDAGTRISIHAPRMGSDCGVPFLGYVLPYFNPRSPDGERLTVKTYIVRIRHFNPRSPDGERPDYRHSAGQVRYISIHAPRMGSDPPCFNGTVSSTTFQSTLPGWGATIVLRHQIVKITISIHAPRMGSDHTPLIFGRSLIAFQSTLPGWGATGILGRG